MSPERLIGGKYRLRERLGEGAHGAVFSAVHVDLQRTFAVKLMPEERWEPRALARFRREAEVLGRPTGTMVWLSRTTLGGEENGLCAP